MQKVLSKKPLVTAKYFTVNELEVEIKPGVVRTHHNVERYPIVHVFALNDHDELILTKEYRYALNRYITQSCSGYVEKDEDPLEGAKRELKEELGLTAQKWTKLSEVELGGGIIQTKIYFFLAQDLVEGTTQFDEGEVIERVTVPFHQILQKVLKADQDVNIVNFMYGILLIDKLKQLGKV